MLQFWQVLCLILTMLVAMLIYEKGIRPDTSVTTVQPSDSIEQMIMKEVL